MGDKIHLLATAPCVNFLNNISIQKQFEDYDLAFINYMIYFHRML